MIQLVLYSNRQNTVAGKLHTFAFTVKKLTFDIFGAFYFAFKIRYRQTAFAADNGTFPFGDNRIDKLDQAFANVDNYYSSGNTYLRRCQAYAVSAISFSKRTVFLSIRSTSFAFNRSTGLPATMISNLATVGPP